MGLIIKLITLWFVLGQFDSDFNGVFTVVPLQIYRLTPYCDDDYDDESCNVYR